MFLDFVIGKKRSQARAEKKDDAYRNEKDLNYTIELLSDPVDQFHPDATAVFRRLKKVETLPEIKAMRPMRVQTDVGLDFESSEVQENFEPNFISRILRTFAFWKHS